MDNNFLKPLAEYPLKALYALGNDQTVVGFLVNNPKVKIGSAEAGKAFEYYLHDYGYVDGTTTSSEAHICIEADAYDASPTMQNLTLYVTIYCHKEFMRLDPLIYKKTTGNRLINLIMATDAVLNGRDNFGIGKLQFRSAKTIPAPLGFVGKELVYTISDFMVS